MVAGSLTYNTKMDTSGFKKGIGEISNNVSSAGTKMRDIIGALGITKLISTAISTINQNIDAAVERVDALNNFPKVMSNLGISAEASQVSINKLSEKLKGLPTTLNDGALAVQRFTSANGDIEKSTEIFLALNNAILAGGASTEIQKSALEQLSQAYAKGRPDMMEWRTALMAMPAQIRQVADTFDMTSDQLGEALREGSISMDDFTNRIIEMNKQGVNGFKSFEEQAKNSVNGIKTSTTNMKTAIARGIGNVITSINNLLKKNNLGGVSDVINKIGSSAEKVLSKIGKLIEKIDIKKLLDTFKKLIPIITSVVAGFLAYEIALKAIEAINIVKSVISTVSAFVSLIPAITSAKDAMLLLNMAMDANPIGLIAGAVAALAAGLIYLSQTQKETADYTKELNDEMQNYNDSMKQLADARQEYLSKGMSEIEHYDNLYQELRMISDENGNIKQGYEDRAKYIVGELSDALGIEIGLVDNQITNYEELDDKVKKVIETKKLEILLQAHEEEYNKAISERTKREEEYTKAKNKTAKAEKEYKKTLEELADEYGTTVEAINEYINGEKTFYELNGQTRLAVNSFKEKMDDTGISLETAKERMDSANTALEKEAELWTKNEEIIYNYTTATGYAAEGNAEAVKKIYDDTVTFNGKTIEENDKTYTTEKTKLEDHLTYLKENKDKYNADFIKSETKRVNDRLAEMEREKEEANKAIENQNIVIKEKTLKGIQEQLDTIKGKRYEFKETSDGNMQLYVDGIEKGKPISVQKAKELTDSVTSKLKEGKIDSEEAGKQLIEGVNRGVSNRQKQNSVYNSIWSFARGVLSTLKSGLDEHSPSKASREMGQYLLEGLNLGIDDEKEDVLKNVDSFGDEVLNRMENAVNIETGKMSFSGTAGSVSEILNANATFEGTQNTNLFLDGEKVYENQQKISARKNLQYGGAR